MTSKQIALYLSVIGLLLILVLAWYSQAFWIRPEPLPSAFDGERALADVETQVAFGARTPGSPGHARTIEWIQAELKAAGWRSHIQSAEMMGHPIRNIVAYRKEEAPEVILAAHYDTRIYADHDPEPLKQTEPVPGANDGASGVAVLLELARSLPEATPPTWLVFFDAEDNGNIQGWDWILGSRAFVQELDQYPEAVVIVDMIGDADQTIYIETNSDRALVDEIWTVAAELGYAERFIAQPKYSMLDDHTPFLQAGIPAVDIIDFDYPYYHTSADTPDKVSAKSLEAVGNTLKEWLIRRNSP